MAQAPAGTSQSLWKGQVGTATDGQQQGQRPVVVKVRGSQLALLLEWAQRPGWLHVEAVADAINTINKSWAFHPPCSSILLPKYPTRLKTQIWASLHNSSDQEREANPAGCSWPVELSWVDKGGHHDPRLSQLWHDRHGWGRGKWIGLREINFVLWLFQFFPSQEGIWPSWEYQKVA